MVGGVWTGDDETDKLATLGGAVRLFQGEPGGPRLELEVVCVDAGVVAGGGGLRQFAEEAGEAVAAVDRTGGLVVADLLPSASAMIDFMSTLYRVSRQPTQQTQKSVNSPRS